ncbi:MAG: single-stranded DNA-binding protein [Mycoplasmoidaceae bacterium]|nr:single-stranded DNA-binding protein [Mycoplasmoidaceae bacterium]
MNKVFLVGNLTADPQPKQTTTGKTLVNFSVACNDNIQGKDHTNFFNCVAWNQQANYLATYVKKGDTVAIDGRLNKRSYVNKEGRNVNVIEIIVDSIKTITKRSKQTQEQEEMVSVNDNFATKIIDTEADFTKPNQPKKVDDGLTELD